MKLANDDFQKVDRFLFYYSLQRVLEEELNDIVKLRTNMRNLFVSSVRGNNADVLNKLKDRILEDYYHLREQIGEVYHQQSTCPSLV